MPLRKTINFKKVENMLIKKRKAKLVLLANEIIVSIRERTQSGKDVNNKPFDKYEKSTIKKKGTSIVDLQDTSKMLNSIDSKEIANGIRLFLKGSRKKGITNNDIAYYNQEGTSRQKKKKKRKFLGTDPRLDKWIAKQLSKL